MFASRPAVHPVEAPPLADEAENPLGVRMKDVQGMPGTPGGLALRLVQFAFAVAALGVMTSTSDFPAVTAFCVATCDGCSSATTHSGYDDAAACDDYDGTTASGSCDDTCWLWSVSIGRQMP
ncbi:hypothetical protein GW17_00057181 [Ensete ventricosum]|nr:hypothetical protein GW17_00057181 [Ensete ventricosum]